MKFSLLLYALYATLRVASKTHRGFRHFIRKARVKILIKTAAGDPARLFIFDRGRVSSLPGDQGDYDAALVWKDAAAGFSVMTSRKKDAVFNAAARGDLKVLGMSVYAMWFQEAIDQLM